MPCLLVVGGQVQGSGLCVWVEGSCSTTSKQGITHPMQ